MRGQESFSANDALTLFLTVESLLLAGSTLGVTTWKQRTAKNSADYAKRLVYMCFGLTALLTVGAVVAWCDLFLQCDRPGMDVLDRIEAGVLLLGIGVLPVISAQFVLGVRQ